MSRLATAFGPLVSMLGLTMFIAVAADQPTSPSIPARAETFAAGSLRSDARAILDLTLTGSDLSEPLALGASFDAPTTPATDDALGKDSSKSHWTLKTPENGPIGWTRLRLLTRHGLSNFRPFCLDSLPQVVVRRIASD